MKNFTATKISLFLAVLAMAFFSCVKTEFDDIPITGTPVDATANTTIKALKALHLTQGGYDKITDDLIIEAVVVMDDRSGNYYKTIVIQDATGGIEVKFNDGYLYNQYPIGRTIYIKCKDLMLADYNGLAQLIGGTKEEAGALSAVGITEAQAREKVLRGLVGQAVTPRIITMNEASNPDFVSTLVQLENVQFIKADTSKTYADGVTKNSLNRTLENCNGGNLLVRTSGYADFAGSLTPGKQGTITGVLSAFGTTPQLYIRNTADVSMTADRCGQASGGIAGGNVVVETLDEKFSGGTVNQDVALAGWSNFFTDGARLWRIASFSNDNYAQATAFGSPDATNETWLITPGITVSTQKTLSFVSSWAYYKHQGLSVWYSTNFNGTNFAAATWQPINCTIAQQANGNGNFGDWVPSGNVSLPVIAGGKVHIGFKYVGDKTNNTTNWRVDNVKVQ